MNAESLTDATTKSQCFPWIEYGNFEQRREPLFCIRVEVPVSQMSKLAEP